MRVPAIGMPRGWGGGRAAFRSWRRSRPFWAGFWALLGGALITYVPATGLRFLLVPGSLLWAGILVGALVLLMGLFLWLQPQLRSVLGVVIILLSLFSFVTSDFGGLFLGLIFGLVGGSLALAWGPAAQRRIRPDLIRVPTGADSGENAEPAPPPVTGE